MRSNRIMQPMQPSKSMVDYTMEMNRLFLKKTENDIQTPSTVSFQSPFSQPIQNYSSSSTDSFSPETFPELSYNRSNFYQSSDTYKPLLESPRSTTDTPFAQARRPIVGRRILGSSDKQTIEQTPPETFNFEQRFGDRLSPMHWSNSRISTPNILIEPKNEANVCYELFPGENRGFELKTPVKTPSVYSNISPTSSIAQNSPVNSSFGMFTPPRYTNPLHYGSRSPMNFGANAQMNFGASSPLNLGATTSRFQDGAQKMCTFCRKNGETPLVFMTHAVKEKKGNKNIVTCPILRSHVCSVCGVSGDNAHTITYCPVMRHSNNGMPLKSTTITLKNTRIKSNGRRRY